MNVTTLRSEGDNVNFSLIGQCPHCLRDAVCTIVGTPYWEQTTPGPQNISAARRYAAVTQCPGCRKYVLAVVTRAAAETPGAANNAKSFEYEAHFPLGKPDDSMEEGVPNEIADDFKEALRCMFVDAYKAAACMCGRALEAASVNLKATGDTLEDKIDDLAKKGQISVVLKDIAHQIRLTRNRGAHAPKNQKQAAETPDKEHAEALIAFTRQFFLHAYTMPLKLKKYANPVTPPQP